MTTATLIDAKALAASLRAAFGLRVQPSLTLAQAIVDGQVRFSNEALDFERLGVKNIDTLRSLLGGWLTGSGMPFQWIDEIVASFPANVQRLSWNDELGKIEVKLTSP